MAMSFVASPLCYADRVLHEWSHSRPVLVQNWWTMAIDLARDGCAMPDFHAPPTVLLSGARAHAMGLEKASNPHAVYAYKMPDPFTWSMAYHIATSDINKTLRLEPVTAPSFAENLMSLALFGRVIPALLVWPCVSQASHYLAIDDPTLFDDLPNAQQASLEHLADVKIPLKTYGITDFHLYRTQGLEDGPLAIRIGNINTDEPLVRIHSSCLTGDLFGSLRCDCGPQLEKALGMMKDAGGGLLIYLFQEGRNTGLNTKLRAYGLQDKGLDTIDADAVLGFGPDERDYGLAVAVLEDMGITSLRLLTNNPHKVAALESMGIKVTQRVALVTKSNRHNSHYLETKARRAGHSL